MYTVSKWGWGITPKNPSGGHTSLGTTQQSYRLTLNRESLIIGPLLNWAKFFCGFSGGIKRGPLYERAM